MNRIKRNITLSILIVLGTACVILSFIFPEVIPILVPIGSALLSGAFGMFQSVIPPTNDDNESTDTQYEDARSSPDEELHDEVHIDHNVNLTDNSVQILFMYDKKEAFQEDAELDDPENIPRPHRPLNLS